MKNFSAKKTLLFLNGQQPTYYPKDFSSYEKIFATDGAYKYLKKEKIFPDVLSGDFDSFNFKNLGEKEKQIKLIETPDQDYTDFEKVLSIIYNEGFSNVDIWGASGKEQDHFLGNLSAAFRYKEKLAICFYDDYHSYFFIPNKFSLEGLKNKMISLFPFPYAREIYTEGLEYPLYGENLDLTRIGIRNKALEDKVKIEYKEGDLLLFVEK